LCRAHDVYVCLRLNKKEDNDIKWNVFIYKQWDKNGKESLHFIFLSQVYIIIRLRIEEMRIRNVSKHIWLTLECLLPFVFDFWALFMFVGIFFFVEWSNHFYCFRIAVATSKFWVYWVQWTRYPLPTLIFLEMVDLRFVEIIMASWNAVLW